MRFIRSADRVTFLTKAVRIIDQKPLKYDSPLEQFRRSIMTQAVLSYHNL